jgi:hypothetical protein
MTENSIAHAIDLIKSGNKEEGKNLLIQQIINDPYNEEAWLWMSSASSGEERITCLQKALEINPDNDHARKMLDKYTAAPTHPDKAKTSTKSTITADLDEDVIFAPDPGLVFLVHILPWLIFLAFLVLMAVTIEDWLQTWHKIILIAAGLLIGLLIMIRKMSVFKVRLTTTGLLAPQFFILPALKQELPYADIDLKRTATALGFIGYYRIRSHQGDAVYLIGYSEETLLRLASLIRYYQSQ